AVRASNRDTAALLAVEAYRMADTPRTRSALLSTFMNDDGYMGTTRLPDGVEYGTGYVMPDGAAFVSGDDQRIRSSDLDSGAIGEPWKASESRNVENFLASHYQGSPDGKLLLQAKWFDDLTRTDIAVYNVATKELITGPIEVPFGVDNELFTVDDTRLYI